MVIITIGLITFVSTASSIRRRAQYVFSFPMLHHVIRTSRNNLDRVELSAHLAETKSQRKSMKLTSMTLS